MGILGQLFRVLSVAGQRDARVGERRPLQLQINDARRELEQALWDGQPDPAPIRARIDEMMRTLIERDLQGEVLETREQIDAAIALYEANVTDMSESSYAYERLLVIYMGQGAKREAQRVARACLIHAAGDLSDELRESCLQVLQIPRG